MQHEQMSALMDDELPAHESGHLIDYLIENEELKQAWGRYHMIGAVMRSSGPSFAANASADTTCSPLEPSSASVIPPPARRGVGRLVTGMAIAASVAALAVTLTLRTTADHAEAPFQMADTLPVPVVQPQSASAIATATPPSTLVISEVMAPVDDYEQRLNGYLVNFNEQRARLGVPGVHPYVRIVGFEPE